jgi:hypothetical protein
MAKYFNQSMSYGTLTKVTYYRVQSAHPNHTETNKFTTDARNDYATANNVPAANVELGTFRSNMGVPTAGVTKAI